MTPPHKKIYFAKDQCWDHWAQFIMKNLLEGLDDNFFKKLANIFCSKISYQIMATWRMLVNFCFLLNRNLVAFSYLVSGLVFIFSDFRHKKHPMITVKIVKVRIILAKNVYINYTAAGKYELSHTNYNNDLNKLQVMTYRDELKSYNQWHMARTTATDS